MKVPVLRNILEANERIAAENRALLDRHGVFCFNLMSSPGAGKTTLLERTIDLLAGSMRLGVIEGDIASSEDALRISRKGVRAVQINTDGACHLDASMVRGAMEEFDLAELDLLVVENVGNLVCPAEFNVGEHCKVMILSVAEGDDTPLKYPLMFHESAVLLINKIDLLPYLDCSVEKIRSRSLAINPKLQIFEVSARTGEGLAAWAEWVRGRVAGLVGGGQKA
ncbi:MAG: hydrogenase nickel incorporation protein HypB [Pseudomonadota bacterium]